MFFQPEIETIDRAALKKLQHSRLQESLARCYHNVEFYRQRFDEANLKPEDIRCLEDITKLPVTTKADFRDNYPFGLFAVDRREVIRYHASSGTTGRPIIVGYTRRDLDMWSDLVARMCMAAGARPGDTAQISFNYGLMTGALGLHMGLEKIGCGVIPISGGNTEKQLMTMRDFGTNILVATPSYAACLGELVQERGLQEKLQLRLGILGSEGCTDSMMRKIEQSLGIVAADHYGVSELLGPGISGECECRCGQHIAEDHFLVEILDPETLEPVPEGEYGEIVVTSLTKECCPIIRYRTRDISRIITEPCACGRTMRRLDRLRGRTDDMLIIQGVNVFPSQIEGILMSVENVGTNYLLVARNSGYVDTLEIQLELQNASLLDSFARLENLTSTIREKLHSDLGLSAKVTLVSPGTLERSAGKARRVLDLRNKG